MPELTDIASPIRLLSANPLLEKHEYNKIGGNGELEVSPSIVHFGGYALHEVHTQRVTIINVSRSSQRLHIVAPVTPQFKISYAKKGLIAPGMSEDIDIHFEPAAFKYHYDCIRVHCEGENLLIPIHAYPVANDVFFPKTLNIGPALLGEVTRERIKMECKVPIQFEYTITVTKPHPAIQISPLKGIIPGNSFAEICVDFRPVNSATAFCEVEVNVSQFGFKPFLASITGLVQAGLGRELALKEASLRSTKKLQSTISAHSHEDGDAIPSGDDKSNLHIEVARRFSSVTLPIEDLIGLESTSMSMPSLPKSPGAGSGVMDAAAEYVSMKAIGEGKKARKKQKALAMTAPEVAPETDYEIEGIRIPSVVSNVTALNFVLTQSPGKLKPKDLKRAIAEQRRRREENQIFQESMRIASSGKTSVVDSIINDEISRTENISRQMRELAFLQEMGEIELAHKTREFSSKEDCIGSSIVSEDEIMAVNNARLRKEYELGVSARMLDRSLTKTVASGIDSTPAERVAYLGGVVPSHTPTFDPYLNDVWRKRSQTIVRFVKVVSKVIVRCRIERRLAKVKAKLGSASSRQAVRALVEMDNRLSNMSVAPESSTGVLERPSLVAANVHPITFVEWVQTDSTSRTAVGTETPSTFMDIGAFRLSNTPEYKLTGHKEMKPPPLPTYIPLEKERKLRVGAPEEEGVRPPRGSSIEESLDLPAPASVLKSEGDGSAMTETPPASRNKLSIPLPAHLYAPVKLPDYSLIAVDSSVRVLSMPLRYDVTDIEYHLRPKPRVRVVEPTVRIKLNNTVGTFSLSAASEPTVSSVWQPRTLKLETPLYSMASLGPIPSALDGPLASDILSDTESDSESTSDSKGVEAQRPTFEMASTLFAKAVASMATTAAAAVPDVKGGKDAGKKPTPTKSVIPTAVDDAKKDDGAPKEAVKPLGSCARDSAYMQVEARKLEIKIKNSNRLPDALERMNEKISDPRRKFVSIIEERRDPSEVRVEIPRGKEIRPYN